jgi:hypothetical protein
MPFGSFQGPVRRLWYTRTWCGRSEVLLNGSKGNRVARPVLSSRLGVLGLMQRLSRVEEGCNDVLTLDDDDQKSTKRMTSSEVDRSIYSWCEPTPSSTSMHICTSQLLSGRSNCLVYHCDDNLPPFRRTSAYRIIMSKRTLDAFFTAPKPKKQKKTKIYKEDSKGVIELDASPSPSTNAIATKDEPIEVMSDDEEARAVPTAPLDPPKKDVPAIFLSSTGFALAAPDQDDTPSGSPSIHSTYPFPILALPQQVFDNMRPSKEPRIINDGVDLDLLCYEPYMTATVAREYGEFVRRELPFYRVQYKINRFGKETEINTPRYTVSKGTRTNTT